MEDHEAQEVEFWPAPRGGMSWTSYAKAAVVRAARACTVLSAPSSQPALATAAWQHAPPQQASAIGRYSMERA